MINLRKSTIIQKISFFFILNLTLFSAPLKVGVSSDFNFELVKFIMEQDKTLDIELVKYENDKNLNRDLLNKKIDINIFQTQDYLNTYNKLNDSSIISAGETYVEPIGIYSKKYSSIKSVVEGAVIAIPRDPSNKNRALIFLEETGLIKLNHKKEVLYNPFKIEIVGVENFLLPRLLKAADYVILNEETAFTLGYTSQTDSLFLESLNKEYINIIAVRKNMVKNKKIIRFSKLAKNQKTKLFILEKYGNNIYFL